MSDGPDAAPKPSPAAKQPARYVVVDHDGAWKINLNNRYFGPFETKDACIAAAKKAAQDAAGQGFPAAALLLLDGGKFEALWSSAV